VESVAFDLDGTSLFSAGIDRRVRSWNSADAGHAKTLARFEADINSLLPADQTIFIGLSDGRVTERRQADGIEVCTFAGLTDRVTALAVDSTSHWLAAGSHDGKVRLWDLRDGEKISEFVAAPGLQDMAAK
jgi:WD40 repeat protein